MAIKGIGKTATPGKAGEKIYTESVRVNNRLTDLEVKQRAAEAEIAILKRSNEMLTFHVQKLNKALKNGANVPQINPSDEKRDLSLYVTPASNRAVNFVSSAELFRLIGKKVGAASITELSRLLARNGYKRAQCLVPTARKGAGLNQQKPEGQPPVNFNQKPVELSKKVRGFYCKIHKSRISY